jgi:dipeptidyl-peptidase-4
MKMSYYTSKYLKSFIYTLCISFQYIVAVPPTFSQQKNIQLEDIWESGLFFAEGAEELRFMKDDHYYSLLEHDENNNAFLTKNALEEEKKEILVAPGSLNFMGQKIQPDDYEFSIDETKILFRTGTERIYRRSFRAEYYIFDIKTKKLSHLSENGKQSYATFSPDGMKVAYVRGNDLFIANTGRSQEYRVTTDGALNRIINGSTDWVYEEEFEFTKSFHWSPDSRKIAFYKFDESQVKEYNMQIWSGLYPHDYRYKYPKAGEENASVSIHCYDLISNKTTMINTGSFKDNYIPRMKWTKNPDLISIQRLNREQNHLELLHASVSSGKAEVVYNEKNDSYIEINDDLTYFNDGQSFLLTSEKDGYRHIYLYAMDGKLKQMITRGPWEVSKFLGVDERNKQIYYTSTEVSPMERYLYCIDYAGENKKQLTKQKGTHEVTFSSAYNYYMDNFSTADTPPAIYLCKASGEKIKTFTDNNHLKEALHFFKISSTEYFQYKTDQDILINASMLKPPDFNEAKQYPVFIYIYGGPGSQNVKNEWHGPDYGWFQMLAQKGYIVVTIDNRGTGGRGASFKKCTQHQLGKNETEDLIAAARYLGSLPYIDKTRIGIFGWSFGGYMSSLAMTVGADYFKAGIAVAPVISWRFYDTIYTERFLGSPKDNPSGYDDNSPITHAGKLKGAYLLVHGTADDNVHLQNSIEMERALINANKQFSTFHYPERNHGIYGGNTRLHLYKMMTTFLQNNL